MSCQAPGAVLLAAAALALAAAGCEGPHHESVAAAASAHEVSIPVRPTSSTPATSPVRPTSSTPATSPSRATSPTRAAKLYDTRCLSCHGPAGQGDGPAAARLARPPRDFGQAGWQDFVTDERIARVIVEGGASQGLSPLMSKNPDLRGEPELVSELVLLVRGFRR